MTRPSEAAGTIWQEIDLENKLWTIPESRIKMDKAHIIPLSPQALTILEIMKPISSHREHVFPTMKAPFNKPMNSQTVNAAIKRLGFGGRLVAHGFRSIASTALAHVDKNSVRRAYNRATYLKQRQVMMDWWGDFVEQASKGSISLSGNKTLKVVNN